MSRHPENLSHTSGNEMKERRKLQGILNIYLCIKKKPKKLRNKKPTRLVITYHQGADMHFFKALFPSKLSPLLKAFKYRISTLYNRLAHDLCLILSESHSASLFSLSLSLSLSLSVSLSHTYTPLCAQCFLFCFV